MVSVLSVFFIQSNKISKIYKKPQPPIHQKAKHLYDICEREKEINYYYYNYQRKKMRGRARKHVESFVFLIRFYVIYNFVFP